MQKANAPIQFVLPFAGSATSQYRNVIPIPSQQGVTPGAASMTDGFPPVTMEPTASGGIPPYGADMNGILYEATLALQWQQAGYVYGYNSTFATNVNVGGYPAGALLRSTAVPSLWLSTTDNNATNPDTSAGANWVPFLPNYGAVSVNTAGGTTTLTMNQMTAPYIYVTGALTSNATLVLPLITGSHFIVYNNTTGAFTLTVQSSTGASVAVTQGQSQWVYCDSANWHGLGLVGGPYLPLDGTAQAAVKLATARNFSITGKLSAGPIGFNGTADVTFNITNVVADSLATPRAFQIGGLASAAAVNFDGTGPVTLNVTSVNVPAALGYTPANDGQVVHIAGTETITGAKTFSSTIAGTNSSNINFDANSASPMYRFTSSNHVWYWQCVDSDGHVRLYHNSGPGTAGELFQFSANGTFTAVSANFTGSDRRLKRHIRKANPRPLHRSMRFVSYTLKANGWNGLGSIAQDVRKVAPEHVGEFDQDGKKYLSLNYAGAAYEQAMWAGHEIDRLTKRIDSLERKLARASIQPRQRGLLRLLLEAIW